MPSGTPIWDDLASPEVRAVLDPGPGSEPFPRPDVLVVGGGVVGLAAAAMCRNRGLSVVVIERERLASGPSGRAAGGLAPDAHPQAGADWHHHATRSLALHRELDDEWSYGLEDVDLRVVPDLVITGQARVDPLAFAAALARNAGEVRTRVEALSWDDDFRTVRTSAGDISAGAVVFATGAPAACDVAHSSVKGHLLATEVATFRTGEITATLDGEFLCIQLPDGRLVCGGTKEPDDPTADVVDATIERIVANLHEHVPAARGLSVTHRWCCFRPKMDGELPLIDRIDEHAWVAAGMYSTGILMAPVVGELLADAIASGAELPVAFRLAPEAR